MKLEQLVKLPKPVAANEGDLESALQTAWALLLRCYTGLDEVCFGYKEARYEAPIAKHAGAERRYFSMPIVRMGFEDTAQLSGSVDMAKETYLRELQRPAHGQERSHSSFPSSQPQLFNTTMVLERHEGSDIRDHQARAALLDEVKTSAGVSIATLSFVWRTGLILLRVISVSMLNYQRIL